MPEPKRRINRHDPQRLKAFQDSLQKMEWKTESQQALERLFQQLSILIYDDVLYYTSVRNKHRKISAITRILAWALGTVGLLVPLVISADPSYQKYAGWGYPFLAGAGSVLLLNRLFGSTKGHVRYVTAQLALEHLIAVFNLRWLSWGANNTGNDLTAEARAEVFKLFNEFIDAAYKIVQDETTVWGIAIMQDLEAVAKQLTGNVSHPDKGSKAENSSAAASEKSGD